MKDKSVKLNMELNSIFKDTEDPTLLRATWILHDFKPSGNRVQLSREVSWEASHTIKNKPIVTFYNEVNEFDTQTDALGGHAEFIGLDKNGNPIQMTETTPIGTITSEAYIMSITNSEGATEEVMACDSVLWLSRFQDACNLLIEWYERGIQIVSSCEYYYKNFTLQDGITHVHSPVYYDGHCILNSEERGGHEVVRPAYDKSVMLSLNELQEFNKLVSQAIIVEESEDKNNMSKKKVKELNEEVEVVTPEVVSEEEVETEVVVETEEEEVVKEVSADEEEEKKAEPFKSNEELVKEVEKLEAKVKELEEKIVKLEEANKTAKSEKSEVVDKLTEATEKVVALDEEVKELSSYKEKYDAEIHTKSLNEKMDYYESKFKALNAMSKFEDEEVKALIEKTVVDNDEGNKATMSLNSMLLDMVVVDSTKNEDKVIKENCSVGKTLINVDTSFDSKYK